MSIGSISSSLLDTLNGLSMTALLRGKKAKDPSDETAIDALSNGNFLEEHDSLAENTLQLADIGQGALEYAGQQNMMARNFASTDFKQSKYITASLDSYSSKKMIQQRADNVAVALLDDFGGVAGPSLYDPYSNRKQSGAGTGNSEAHIKMMLRRRASKEVMEKAEEELKKAQEHIEENAEEALTPQDADGQPVPAFDDDPSVDVPVIGDFSTLFVDTASTTSELPSMDTGTVQAAVTPVSIDIRV